MAPDMALSSPRMLIAACYIEGRDPRKGDGWGEGRFVIAAA
jgi:hypothetical protein